MEGLEELSQTRNELAIIEHLPVKVLQLSVSCGGLHVLNDFIIG